MHDAFLNFLENIRLAVKISLSWKRSLPDVIYLLFRSTLVVNGSYGGFQAVSSLDESEGRVDLRNFDVLRLLPYLVNLKMRGCGLAEIYTNNMKS